MLAAPKEVINIEKIEQFENMIQKFNHIPIIIDFWAPWCGPCKKFTPIFLEAHKNGYGEKFVFAKLNTDSEAGEIARGLGVTGIPTIVFFLNNNEIHRIVGGIRKKQFYNILDELVNNYRL